MSHRSRIFLALCLVGAFVALGCTSRTPELEAAERDAARRLSYQTPIRFSTKQSACDFAVKKVRRRAVNSCSLTALSVRREDCSCSRQGSAWGCSIEAAYTCE